MEVGGFEMWPVVVGNRVVRLHDCFGFPKTDQPGVETAGFEVWPVVVDPMNYTLPGQGSLESIVEEEKF